MKALPLILIFQLLGFSSSLHARIIHVPGDSPTIQGAIDGGIRCHYGSPRPEVANNITADNSAVRHGGGLYCSTGMTIINNTISGNSAEKGGGFYCRASAPAIDNTIIWGNEAPAGPEIYVYMGSGPVVTYSDIMGGWVGEGNIDADP